jgi:hypothetical protein
LIAPDATTTTRRCYRCAPATIARARVGRRGATRAATRTGGGFPVIARRAWAASGAATTWVGVGATAVAACGGIVIPVGARTAPGAGLVGAGATVIAAAVGARAGARVIVVIRAPALRGTTGRITTHIGLAPPLGLSARAIFVVPVVGSHALHLRGRRPARSRMRLRGWQARMQE